MSRIDKRLGKRMKTKYIYEMCAKNITHRVKNVVEYVLCM